MEQNTIIQFIKTHYPTMRTIDVAKQLHLSSYQVRSIAKKHNIKKCEKYKQQLKQQLIQHRKKWYEANIPDFNPTLFQEQIMLILAKERKEALTIFTENILAFTNWNTVCRSIR